MPPIRVTTDTYLCTVITVWLKRWLKNPGAYFTLDGWLRMHPLKITCLLHVIFISYLHAAVDSIFVNNFSLMFPQKNTCILRSCADFLVWRKLWATLLITATAVVLLHSVRIHELSDTMQKHSCNACRVQAVGTAWSVCKYDVEHKWTWMKSWKECLIW